MTDTVNKVPEAKMMSLPEELEWVGLYLELELPPVVNPHTLIVVYWLVSNAYHVYYLHNNTGGSRKTLTIFIILIFQESVVGGGAGRAHA